jgi:hypothetical protein
MSISSNVSQHRGNTIVISTGDSNYVWNDKNNDGVVNEGDLIVCTKQSDASVTTWVVGQDEGLHAWGDPHLDNFTLTNDAKQTLTVALQAAFDDAKEDGQLDNQRCLVDIDQALASRGQREGMVDFHHDIVVKTSDGTRLKIDVAELGDVAFTENVDIEVLDENGNKLTLTISEVWAGNGGANLSGVRETTGNPELQAVPDKEAEDLHTIFEYKGANVVIDYQMFGKDVGTKEYAKVIDIDGELHRQHGEVRTEAVLITAAEHYGNETMLMAFQLGIFDIDEQQEMEKNEEERRANHSADTVATANSAASI